MTITADHHRAIADACEVELQALALLMAATKRRRDAHRAMEKFFTPPETPLGSPLPPIEELPKGHDPDFDDPPPGAPNAADGAPR